MSHKSWCSSEEWSRLSTMVCSISDDPNNVPRLELTISMLNCFYSRLPSPPFGAVMTSELLQALLATAKDSDQDALRQNRPHMAFAIVRFVNHVTHAYQSDASFGRQPMHKVAAQQRLPDWLVTLRHDAVHGELPAPPLLRNALLAALQWTVDVYWRPQPPPTATDPATPDPEDVSLRRLECSLAGPRGRRLDRALLLRCLSSETLRERAIRAVAQAMVASYLQLGDANGGHERTVTQSWKSAVYVISRDGLLTELLESLLTVSPASAGQQQAAALWLERLLTAVRRGDADSETDAPGRDDVRLPADTFIQTELSEAVRPAGPLRWGHLLDTALRHKNPFTARLLPPLLAGLTPPLPERRRQLLLQLVSIATGAAGQLPSPRPAQPVSIEQLRRLGVCPPAEDEQTPAPPAGATAAPPAYDGAMVWRLCSDGPQWRQATEVGRLPWQHKTPLLLDAVLASEDGSA